MQQCPSCYENIVPCFITVMLCCIQLSMERLPQLEKQAYAWKGKMSVAVYLAAPRHHPNAEKAITKLIDFHHKLEATSACHMDISVMYANHNEECKDISDQVSYKCIVDLHILPIAICSHQYLLVAQRSVQ